MEVPLSLLNPKSAKTARDPSVRPPPMAWSAEKLQTRQENRLWHDETQAQRRMGWHPEFQRHSSTSREVRERLGANRTIRPTWFVGQSSMDDGSMGALPGFLSAQSRQLVSTLDRSGRRFFSIGLPLGSEVGCLSAVGGNMPRHSTIFKYHKNTPTMPPSSHSHPGLSQGSKTSVILGIVRNNSLFIRSMEGAL
jgi:hypothetical protein